MSTPPLPRSLASRDPSPPLSHSAAPPLLNSPTLELIAQGPDPIQRWRQEVLPGGPYLLGRLPTADFPVPWDGAISRRHLEIYAEYGKLELRLCDGVDNPVFIDGEPLGEPREISSGAFAIGDTTFHVRQSRRELRDRTPLEHTTFEPRMLRAVRFDDADRRIEVLSRLPAVILGALSEDELRDRLIDLILTGVPRADAAAIVSGHSANEVAVLRQDRRRALEGSFRPSTHLVAEALARSRSVLHVWDADDAPNETDFTAVAEFDWAFCTPLPPTGGEPLGIYVTGRLDATSLLHTEGSRPMAASALQADVKFAELVADILRSILRLNNLEHQAAGLRQFLAPPILAALGESFDAKLLEPRQCEATVLFCDLRGFSAKAEEASSNLIGLLERVSQALGVMTESILAHGGVTGDFLGDAALGFWGWPFSSEQAPLDACRAALAISREFAEAGRSDHPLKDFRVGIGIAHGPAVAGKIGTRDQVKFTVFGPVVNLASRLEGMTKQLRVPILLDEATAEIVRERLPAEEGRTRQLARVLPYGSERPLTVSELLPSLQERPGLTNEHLKTYESGVEAFSKGQWDEAYRLLHRLPPEDRAPDFLNQLITAQNRVPPPGWDGIIKLSTK